MNYKKENTKKAQIMLITLIVLMVVAIVIVGLVILIQRDTKQVDKNRQSSQISNAAESTLYEYVKANGTYLVALRDIEGNNCTQQSIDPLKPHDTIYVCTESDNKYSSSYVEREVEIRDTHLIENEIVPKDQIVTIRLAQDASNTGYTGSINFTWTGTVALEFTLVYEELLGGNAGYYTNKDVFDAYGIFNSSAVHDPIASSPVFKFKQYDALNRTNSTTITISENIPGWTVATSANYVPRYLIITPRAKTQNYTELSVVPSDYTNFPFQRRKFTVTAYDSSQKNSPTSAFEAVLPLVPQLDSIFNYALLSESQLSF